MKVSYLNDKFFSRLETLSLNLKASLRGYFGGKHLVSTYGQTVEFADYREYQLGDDIRRIDWNLFSRFEKYFLKLFTDERQMQIQIFLDCSGSMGKDNPAKSAYATATAAALGFLSVHNMDKVSFNIMKGERADNPFGTIVGKPAFYRSVSTLANVEFEGSSDIASCVTSCPDTSTGNGLTVIISDFFTEGKIDLVHPVESERVESFKGHLAVLSKDALVKADVDDLSDEPPGFGVIALHPAFDGEGQFFDERSIDNP